MRSMAARVFAELRTGFPPVVASGLARPSFLNLPLTPKQARILRRMRDEDEELVFERGVGYVGLERVGRRLVFGLLCRAVVSMAKDSRIGKFERYHINETGRKALAALEAKNRQ